ncbi:MAG: hypothetical protein HKN60_05825 [Rhizobiales bacterium]|nr:hypothetical protein [Hyphomicrobiales bacterium]
MTANRGIDVLKAITAALVLWAGLSAPAQSAVCAGVDLPDTLEREELLVLNGMGIRIATIFNFHMYVAGLYVPEPQTDPESIIGVDQSRVLVMVFLRDVSQRTMRKAIAEAIEVNAADRDMSTVIDQLSIVPEVLPEVNEGQALIFDYAPGYGTAVMLDGETIANIEGDAFASALFSLWLGVPANEELKVGLLGGQCEE